MEAADWLVLVFVVIIEILSLSMQSAFTLKLARRRFNYKGRYSLSQLLND